ncbi:MAG TPA: hypothetical protein VHU84_14770, partial [Lacipirellulaceae bacterium]|nr:hypothetical protein [Lacipirellulaceae bacterium]
ITVPGLQSIKEGNRIDLTPLVSFVDDDASTNHEITINWGDGTVSAPISNASPGAIAFSHVYASNKTYRVSITVKDAFNAPVSAQFDVDISNVVPPVVIPPIIIEPPVLPVVTSIDPPPIAPTAPVEPTVITVNALGLAEKGTSSGGQYIEPPPQLLPTHVNLLPAQAALQKVLSQPRHVSQEELRDRVYALSDFELVSFDTFDMGDEPLPPKKKETENAEEVHKIIDPPPSISETPPEVSPAQIKEWKTWELWSVLAAGTMWVGGAWWWRSRKRTRSSK